MKLTKQILEAIQRGISLAIDDFDDVPDITTQKTGEIKNTSNTREILEFNALIKKLKKRAQNLTWKDLNRLSDLYKILGIKYTISQIDLRSLISHITKNHYFSKLNLNWIDTSQVTDMSNLFEDSIFNGDISEWDVSNVTNMSYMFMSSRFNGDISNWDVSNVVKTSSMFQHSKFNGDISRWNTKNLKYMSYMFCESEFNQDISSWNVSNVVGMSFCFAYNHAFNQDLSEWKVSKKCVITGMFDNCTSLKHFPKWFDGDVIMT